jgi:cell division protein FtsI/penicillin-binding protein 2
MVTIAQRLGDGKTINRSARDIMYDYFHNKFGLGDITGVELTGEASGQVISPEEQEGNAVRYSNMSFGQGMDLTMIQVSAAFSSIVNGGRYFKPTVLAGTIDASGVYQPATVKALRTTISKSTSDQVKEMTRTARAMVNIGVDKPGYFIGGKTGTSEVAKNGEYIESETVGTYLGYGGSNKNTPSYVIMVQLSGKSMSLQGGRDAMPVFSDISNWMIDYLKLRPKE